jgi:hypothetical protein
MLLRISLIVAILAGLGAVAVSHLKVKTGIEELTASRDDFKTKLETTQTDLAKKKKDLATTSENLRIASSQLNQATNDLASMTVTARQQEKRANEASASLEKAVKERNTAQDELAGFKALDVRPEQIKQLVSDLSQTTKERDAFAGENEVLLRNNLKLQADLRKYLDPNEPVAMKVGLKGKVVAVDPKWNFVVLDVGADQGALERGEMLVNRNGKLVAKVRITSVERNRCIANVLPEWSWSNILEGDQVIY